METPKTGVQIQRYRKRTPAMVAGLTRHRWSVAVHPAHKNRGKWVSVQGGKTTICCGLSHTVGERDRDMLCMAQRRLLLAKEPLHIVISDISSCYVAPERLRKWGNPPRVV